MKNKSDRQKAKEIEKVTAYLNLIYNEGKTQQDAAEIVGNTVSNLQRLRKKYAPSNFEETLKEGGFDPHNWNHGWLKSDHVSIHIKNREQDVSYDDVRDEMIRAMKAHAPAYHTIKREKSKEPHLLIIDPADIHLGKLAVSSETGSEYNLEVAQDRVREGVSGLLTKVHGFDIDKILLVIGNDILHIDSPHRKTTSGTQQDTDGQWHQAFIAARSLYVHLVELLLPIADVHVIHCPSNHDFMSGFMVADSLASWFHNSKNVTFDIDMRHRKYFKYGLSLVGVTHGDAAKEKDLAKLMATESKQLWAETEYRYFYAHHLHHKIAKDDIGVCIEYMRSSSSADAWHDRQGYVTQPAIEAFLHSQDRGQLARLTHYC